MEAASLPLQALATRHPLGAASLRGHAQCQLVDFSEKGTEKVRHIQRKKAGSSPRAQQACGAARCRKQQTCCFSSSHHVLTWDDSGSDRKGAFKLRNSPRQWKLIVWDQTCPDLTPGLTIISYMTLDKFLRPSQPKTDKENVVQMYV